MKGLHLLGMSAAASAILIFAASQADAQRGGGRGGGVRASSSGSIGGASRGGASRANTANRGGNRGANVNRSGNTINTGDRNININNDIDIDVDNNGWGGYHPVARGAAVAATTAVVMGAYYSTLPTGCMKVIRVGITYYQCGANWYQPTYSGTTVQYVVVAAP